MANWLGPSLSLQVNGGFFHDLVMFRKARRDELRGCLVARKGPSVLQHFAQLHMQTFNGIGGVDDLSHLRRITVKGDDLLPISAPALGDHRIFFAPGAGFELAEPFGGGLRGFGPIDGFELGSQGLALFPAAKGQAPEELDNHRNGYSEKTVVGEDGAMKIWKCPGIGAGALSRY